MSLFTQGSALVPGSRSHTSLVKSPGDSPSVQYTIDPTLPGLFEYQYAINRRLSKVVIPKGTIVSVGAAVKDYATLKYRNTVTFADGTVNSLPIGVAPYSYFRRYTKDTNGNEVIAHDQFGGDDFQPGIITREFIEVPYMPNPADVYTYAEDGTTANGMKMVWGCATNAVADLGTATALKAGDFVKPGAYGKFVKWNTGDDPRLIVGQVLEMDTDLPPLGWLKYVEPVYEGSDSERENNPIESAPADGSQVYDKDYKWPLTMDYKSPGAWKTIGNAFPGLTDGATAALTTRIQKFTLAKTTTTVACQLDLAATVDGTSLDVMLGETQLTTTGDNKYAYDAKTQKVTITATADADNDRVVRIAYKVDTKSLLGTPAAWDYAGSIGAVRILLKL